MKHKKIFLILLSLIGIQWPLSEALAQNQMDLEKYGFRVEVIKPNIAEVPQTENKFFKRGIKKEVRKMRKNGWRLYQSDKSMIEAVEWLFYANGDDNVIVLKGFSDASDLEEGWHYAYSSAVMECLRKDTCYVNMTTTDSWMEFDDSSLNALGDDFLIIDSTRWSVHAYKYNLEGLSYKSIGVEPVDSEKALSLANFSFSQSWDFETVEKAKKKVASGYSFSLYRRSKDSETGQPKYEMVSFFVVIP